MNSRAFSDHFRSNTDSGGGRQQSTAIRGASHACSLTGPKETEGYSGTNGALAAASFAGMGMRRQGVYGVHLTEGATSNGQSKERLSMKTPVRSGVLKTDRSPWNQSPSHTAALPVTSRPTPVSTQKSINSTPNVREPLLLPTVMGNAAKASSTTSHLTDETMIGATSSLVSLFESKCDTQKSDPILHSVRYVTKPASAIAAPLPIKPCTRPASHTTDSLITFPLGIKPEKACKAPDTSSTMKTGPAATITQSDGPTGVCTTRSSKSAHSIPLPRTMLEPPALPRPQARAPSGTSLENGRNLPRNSLGCAPSAFPRAWPAEPGTASHISQSDPAFLSPNLSSARPSRPDLPFRYSRSFEMKVDSLANTIVAASLASSRAPSPTKIPKPQPRRHMSHSLFHDHHSRGQMSRTPSPAKAMRQTMRESLPSDEDTGYKKKSILMRKHPHKHHEADRRRYRAVVTERERRRYDGVWAANKGLWMDANSSDSVLNLVVRDIWSRSRLPDDVLADIWDLVSVHGSDRLRRSEFIIGMWLIDQRLKGRKLPLMVSESLWNSVRLLHGVNVYRHQN